MSGRHAPIKLWRTPDEWAAVRSKAVAGGSPLFEFVDGRSITLTTEMLDEGFSKAFDLIGYPDHGWAAEALLSQFDIVPTDRP